MNLTQEESEISIYLLLPIHDQYRLNTSRQTAYVGRN
jgi:hypothetical protein